MNKYPHTAGYRENTTSRDAANAIEESGRAATLRAKVLEHFKAGNRGTSEEVAAALGESFQSVQPRISELRTRDLVAPSGERKRLSRGGIGHVWKLK